jgi:putative acetyltransferase
MKIRPATNADAPAVRDLIFAVLDEYGLQPDPSGTDSDLEDIEGQYIARGGMFEVVEDEQGRIVGSVGLYPELDNVVELRKMYLHPDTRGRGLGKQLLERALAAARAKGFRRVELETAAVLASAIALYERYGFTPFEKPHVAARCDQAFALDL